MRATLLLNASLLLLAPAAWGLSPAGQAGRAAIKRAQCNRCHDVTDATGKGQGVANYEREMHCVDCHTWILDTRGDPVAIARQRQEFPDWDRYLKSIVHFIRLPDLGTLARRVRPEFVRAYLDAPSDLRPHLEESMIPLRLTAKEKDQIVAYLFELNGDAAVPKGATIGKRPSKAHIAEGRNLFLAKGCPTCHLFANARLMPGFDRTFYRAMLETARTAPNLRHARRRLSRASLLAYVQDPKGVDPAATMPNLKVLPAEAERLADFVLHAKLDYSGRLPSARRVEIPVLDREVPYEEVRQKILGLICVHCHMDPASNAGDGGAGNTGGLTFSGLQLNLETYEGIKAGLVREGKRASVIDPRPEGEPLLLDSLLRRFDEANRDDRPPFSDAADLGTPTGAERPGMPLGLPPMSVEQLSLLKTWLRQGAKGPKS